MSFLRLYRRITAWMVLAAMLLGALAPAVTQARVSSGDFPHWLEMCSATGMVWVQPGTGEVRQERPEGPSPLAQEHPECPWCHLHGGAAALPPPPVLVDLPTQTAIAPRPCYSAPITGNDWAPAQSRAPPLAA